MTVQRVGSLDLAPPPQPASAEQTFKDLGALYKWDNKVVRFVIDHVKLGSVEEFYYLIRKPDDAEELIVKGAAMGDLAGQQTARVLQAWDAVKKAITVKNAIAEEGASAKGLDEPIGHEALNDINTKWFARYHLTFPAVLDPPEKFVSRIVREISARTLCMHDMLKIPTVASAAQPKEVRELANDLFMKVDKDLAQPANVTYYLRGMHSYAIALAKAGVIPVAGTAPSKPEAKGSDPTKYVIVPLDTIMKHYYRAALQVGAVDFAYRYEWLTQRDKADRQTWADRLVNSDLPLGTIIEQVFRERENSWTPGPELRQADKAAGNSRKRSAEPPRFLKTLQNGKNICQGYQSDSCRNSDVSCREGVHVCAKAVGGGNRACGLKHPGRRCKVKG